MKRKKSSLHKSDAGSSARNSAKKSSRENSSLKSSNASADGRDLEQRNERQKEQSSLTEPARPYRPSRSPSTASHGGLEYATADDDENVPTKDSIDGRARVENDPRGAPDCVIVDKGISTPVWFSASDKSFLRAQRDEEKSMGNASLNLSNVPVAPSGTELPGAAFSSPGPPGRVSGIAASFPPPTYSNSAVPTAEDFHRFYWKCMTLKSELIRLDFALRSVAASGPGIQAANDVKRQLRHLRDIYGINTAVLYPKDVNTQMYTPTSSRLYLDRFPAAFFAFASALDAVAKAFNDFNDVYHDETLTTQLFVLHERFKSEASKLEKMKASVTEVKIHIQCSLIDWVEPAVESLIEPVRNFQDKGVALIGFAQQNKTSRYFDMTTIATFLSGVTASMIQVTASASDTVTGVAANTFFFSSLVFSIGSAVNSLLVMSWRRSVVREPEGALKLWLKTWLNMGPMVSLIISGAFFSVALCLSAFSTGQHLVTSYVTIGFSGVHAAMLVVLALLHLKEKWRFRKKAGHIGRDLTEDSIVLTLIDWVSRSFRPWRRRSAFVSYNDIGKNKGTSNFNPLSIAEKGPMLAPQDMHGDIRDKKDSVLELLLDNEDGHNSPKHNWNALADEDFFLPIAYIPGDYSTDHPVVDILASPGGSRAYRPSRSPSVGSAGSRIREGFSHSVPYAYGYGERAYQRSRSSSPRLFGPRSPRTSVGPPPPLVGHAPVYPPVMTMPLPAPVIEPVRISQIGTEHSPNYRRRSRHSSMNYPEATNTGENNGGWTENSGWGARDYTWEPKESGWGEGGSGRSDAEVPMWASGWGDVPGPGVRLPRNRTRRRPERGRSRSRRRLTSLDNGDRNERNRSYSRTSSRRRSASSVHDELEGRVPHPDASSRPHSRVSSPSLNVPPLPAPEPEDQDVPIPAWRPVQRRSARRKLKKRKQNPPIGQPIVITGPPLPPSPPVPARIRHEVSPVRAAWRSRPVPRSRSRTRTRTRTRSRSRSRVRTRTRTRMHYGESTEPGNIHVRPPMPPPPVPITAPMPPPVVDYGRHTIGVEYSPVHRAPRYPDRSTSNSPPRIVHTAPAPLPEPEYSYRPHPVATMPNVPPPPERPPMIDRRSRSALRNRYNPLASRRPYTVAAQPPLYSGVHAAAAFLPSVAIRPPKRRKRREHPAMMHSAYGPGPQLVQQLPTIIHAPPPLPPSPPPPPVTVVGSLGHRASSVLVEPPYTSSLHGRPLVGEDPPEVQPLPMEYSANSSSGPPTKSVEINMLKPNVPPTLLPGAAAPVENPSQKSSLQSMRARSFVSP